MKKNIYLYAFIGVMAVFTIAFFTAAIKSSYAFPTGKENTKYEEKLNIIKKCAQTYGEQNPDLFKEEENIYITVDELVKMNYLIADNEDGEVKDPSSEVKTLNDIKIRITNKDGKITTKIIDKG